MMAEKIKLTHFSKTAGCAAKLPPGTLAKVLGTLPKFEKDKNLIVGFETSDDAAVYKITDDVAMIQTVDFFTPVVDDPYVFGQIAATNALSDVWAMGGDPVVALNIVAFPNALDVSILGEILAGGADKVKEAGASLVGGHSIQDDEPKYGLCVSGLVHPKKILKNYGCRPGDVLVLTKEIGCGIVNTAVKAEMASESAKADAIRVMTSLNQKAKRVGEHYDISACTDVTGFGLAGHCMEMASASGVSFEIDVKNIAHIDDAPEYAKMGLVPCGAYRNRSYVGDAASYDGLAEHEIDLVCDPQTSGGLLFAVPEAQLPAMLKDLKEAGMNTQISVIGHVIPKLEKTLYFISR